MLKKPLLVFALAAALGATVMADAGLKLARPPAA
jgi:hypothetical protein